ncbi:MAG: hypothetical protein ABI221_00380 [Candidatus Saccharimonadales bacterium]
MKSPFNRIFHRKTKQDNISIPVPEEIKAYYQAESKDNMFKIWLLSGATFIVTLVIVLGFFWGGRWMWRRSHQPNVTSPVTATTSQSQPSAKKQSSTETKPADQTASSSTNSSTNTPAVSQTPAAPSTSASTSTQSSSQLVDTGPGNVDL